MQNRWDEGVPRHTLILFFPDLNILFFDTGSGEGALDGFQKDKGGIFTVGAVGDGIQRLVVVNLGAEGIQHRL